MPPKKKGPSKTKPPKDRIMLAYPHPGMVSHGFHESVVGLLLDAQRKYAISISHAKSGPLISRARNRLTESFLQSESTHLLFIDTDMVFESKTVQTLLDQDLPIVAGLCYGVYHDNLETFVAALTRKDHGLLTPLPKEELPEKGNLQVDAVGMAFTLIKREVLEAMEVNNIQLQPFAETMMDGRAVGEDVTFCLRAKEKGFGTYLCVDARVGHIKQFII